jgi:excisionase family DNA binding protein
MVPMSKTEVARTSKAPALEVRALERRGLRVDEAAVVLGVSRRTMYEFMRRGTIAYFRLPGGQRRVSSDSIDAFIQRNMVEARSEDDVG